MLGYDNLAYMPYIALCTFIIGIIYISNTSPQISESVRIIGFIKYVLYLLMEITKSSLHVSKIIWSPRMTIKPSVKWIDSYKTMLPNAIYANSITLTPGTVTVATSNDKLLIHALNKTSIAELEQGAISEKIRSIICSH